MNFLKRAGLSLLAHRIRTLVMLATFVAISTMVLGGVLIKGGTARAEDAAVQRIGADVTLGVDMDSLVAAGQLQAPQISADIIDKIGTSPLVEAYNYDSFNGARLRGGTRLAGESMDPSIEGYTLVMGVRDSRLMPDFSSGKWKLLAGKPLTDTDRNSNGILIEERLARKNDFTPGDKITLADNDGKRTAEFTVRGVYRDPSDQPDPEYMQFPGDRLIITASALSALDGATGPVELRGATFKLKDPASFEEFEAHAQKQAGAALEGFTIDINDKALKQMTGPLAAVSSAATVAMWLIGLAGAAILALLIALAVKQRRREYGVLLAMGERRWKLIAQQAAEIVAVAALAIGLSSLVAEPLTQRAGTALLNSEAADAQRKLDAWEPPPPGSTGLDQGYDPNDQPVEGADPIDEITVRLDNGALATVAGTGLVIALLATALPGASVLRLNPKTILTEGT